MQQVRHGSGRRGICVLLMVQMRNLSGGQVYRFLNFRLVAIGLLQNLVGLLEGLADRFRATQIAHQVCPTR